MNPYDLMNVSLAVKKMRENSEMWYSVSQSEQQKLSEENRALSEKLKNIYGIPIVYQPDGGTWHVGSLDGPLLYDLY